MCQYPGRDGKATPVVGVPNPPPLTPPNPPSSGGVSDSGGQGGMFRGNRAGDPPMGHTSKKKPFGWITLVTSEEAGT